MDEVDSNWNIYPFDNGTLCHKTSASFLNSGHNMHCMLIYVNLQFIAPYNLFAL